LRKPGASVLSRTTTSLGLHEEALELLEGDVSLAVLNCEVNGASVAIPIRETEPGVFERSDLLDWSGFLFLSADDAGTAVSSTITLCHHPRDNVEVQFDIWEKKQDLVVDCSSTQTFTLDYVSEGIYRQSLRTPTSLLLQRGPRVPRERSGQPPALLVFRSGLFNIFMVEFRSNLVFANVAVYTNVDLRRHAPHMGYRDLAKKIKPTAKGHGERVAASQVTDAGHVDIVVVTCRKAPWGWNARIEVQA